VMASRLWVPVPFGPLAPYAAVDRKPEFRRSGAHEWPKKGM